MSTLPRKRWGAGLVLSIAPIVLPLVSCAEVTIRKATENAEGLRFYRPAPYLQVSEAADTTDGGSKSGGAQATRLQFSIVWLPDYKQEYIVQSRPGFGSVTFKPTLADGWNLTGMEASMDSKTAEILTALAGLLPKATGRAKPTGGPCPGLYRLERNTEGGFLQFDKDEWKKRAVFQICGS